MVTTEDIKELREKTGVSIMQCKKALEEAGGDMGKALVVLQKKSKESALKKSDRTLGSGTVACYLHGEGAVGAMVLLSSETDFVSKNKDFKALAYDIAMHVAAMNPEYLSLDEVSEEEKEKAKEVFLSEVEGKPEEMKERIMEGKLGSFFGERALLEQSFVKDPQVTVRDLVESAIQKFGEKVEISKFTRFSAS